MKTAEQIQKTIDLLEIRRDNHIKELLDCALADALELKHQIGKLNHTLSYLKDIVRP